MRMGMGLGKLVLMLVAVVLSSSGVAQDVPITALHGIILTLVLAPGAPYRGPSDHSYDSDSFVIAVDNCASKCITNSMTDFIEQPRKVKVKIKGVAADSAATFVGAVKWKIEDDNGKLHTFYLPDTFYHGQAPYRLLSPQH
jgi:hypothetical protein